LLIITDKERREMPRFKPIERALERPCGKAHAAQRGQQPFAGAFLCGQRQAAQYILDHEIGQKARADQGENAEEHRIVFSMRAGDQNIAQGIGLKSAVALLAPHYTTKAR